VRAWPGIDPGRARLLLRVRGEEPPGRKIANIRTAVRDSGHGQNV